MSYDIIELDNPYPLGVPERVRKEWNEDYDRVMAEVLRPTPRFVIDCECMTGRDMVNTVHRLRDWLDEQSFPIDPHTESALLNHVRTRWAHESFLRRIIVSWSDGQGWFVLVHRSAT